MNITINPNLQSTLDGLCAEQNMTNEDYCTNILNSALTAIYRNNLIELITTRSIDDVVPIADAMNQKISDINAANIGQLTIAQSQ